MKKILIPVTNHATLGTTDEANGTFAPELTHALQVFLDAGFDYDIASISGGAVPVYGTDMPEDTVNTQLLADATLQAKLANSIPVAQVDGDAYDAIFYPGGFGLLSDLAENEDFAAISAKHYEEGGIVAAVCHGPAALLPITLSNGEKLLAHTAVTGFTREEEVDYGTITNIPFLLEEALARNAARYSKVQPWGSFVVEDDRVITGQNPASAHAVGEAVTKHLNQ